MFSKRQKKAISNYSKTLQQWKSPTAEYPQLTETNLVIEVFLRIDSRITKFCTHNREKFTYFGRIPKTKFWKKLFFDCFAGDFKQMTDFVFKPLECFKGLYLQIFLEYKSNNLSHFFYISFEICINS